MHLATKTIYGVTITLVALLIISSTAGAYYYYEYLQATQSKNQYVIELATATSQYDALALNYNSSLALYNETFSLLVRTISAVNTSLPIYQQASSQLSQLWSRYLSLKPASNSLYVADILIDFGNGTRHWYNDTQVQPGWNMYVETVVLSHGNLQAQWYPQYQEHFVSGIDGVSNSATRFWFLWTYNETASWQTAQVGADQLPVYNGSVFAWTYCGETPAYAPTCTP
jgi:hypothetical protein